MSLTTAKTSSGEGKPSMALHFFAMTPNLSTTKTPAELSPSHFRLRLLLPSSEPYRSFLKGLIQTAAALIQCDRGKWEGALNLLERVQRYLSRCPPKLWGVDVANLLEQVCAFREEVAKLARGQKTRFNWMVKPRITLEGATVPFRERLRRSKTDLPERRKG
jgi:hypothetical protein